MHHQSLFVFDIETVPDTDAVPNLTGFAEADVVARRAELERYHLEITQGKNAFARQPFHKVVAISFLHAEIERAGEREVYYLKELRSGGAEASSEKDLIKGFFGFIDRHRPRLVSFNGRGFDIPVLKYRAMKHGVSAHTFATLGDKWASYGARYATDWHCDLLEVMSDFGASARIRLNEAAAVMGFPGKIGVDGAMVAPMYDEGRLGEIRDYCESDVLNTYLVYLRQRLFTGAIDADGYNRAVADIIALIEAEGEARPHLGEFMAAWGVASGDRFLLD
ncbi:3'-5' exonuclease [Varunaivibrio sulfuroxidans]|uniref:Putative 3'-5' exonuclease similar to PolB exonuclease domain n=1 Tax=Varunaivibrio sulfuroxidans TaxID=1773489 RepID=A0A4R3JGK3_9PROT|nr:3'-5' exonuclease [Varunaivibrio sulfuroxidans]TCS65027.1 putative 3'-5' exonuclease similar to PolB exonuclease domain [Varunaivibrio sulfuroxidans]WES29683.1 3'-5' exonuclease [Varunaivibrio sulfuroxidans]